MKDGRIDMAEVNVLVEGYAREKGGIMLASPSSVLVKDNGLNVLVDPGANRDLLVEGLRKAGLTPKDIDVVYITHYHPDHILNIRLFPDKDVLEGGTIYRGDKEISFSDRIPNTNIRIIETPGHAHEHTSLLVKTEKGKIVIAGDVWWWTDDQKQRIDRKSLLNHKDSYAKDKTALLKSRKRILSIADYIIPGHGKMFEVKK